MPPEKHARCCISRFNRPDCKIEYRTEAYRWKHGLLEDKGAQTELKHFWMDDIEEVIAEQQLIFDKKAEKVMKKWLQAPDPGRIMTKQDLRGARKQAWEAAIPTERATVWKAVSNPKIVNFHQ